MAKASALRESMVLLRVRTGMRVCLHLNLDRDKKIPSESVSRGTEYRLYEAEAVRCVESWRHNAGWLAGVDVYGVVSEKSAPKRKTLDKLESLGVKLVWDSRVWREAFMNTVHSQFDFERNCAGRYDFIIHTDLDLYAKQPLPESLF